MANVFMSQDELRSAMTLLDIAANGCENNEPINRASGNVEQADLERANARAYRLAIEVLKARAI